MRKYGISNQMLNLIVIWLQGCANLPMYHADKNEPHVGILSLGGMENVHLREVGRGSNLVHVGVECPLSSAPTAPFIALPSTYQNEMPPF